jgi:serine/threonine protein kinase
MTDTQPPPAPSASSGSVLPAGSLSPLLSRRLAGRFDVLRWLGEGGMGTVYLARDLKLDRRVALKVLLGGEPDALTRFKQEFRALADISHPNLIVLHELLCEDGMWLFTMDYVEGRDFLQHVSALEGRDAPTLLEVDAHRLRNAGPRAVEPLLARSPVRDPAQLTRVLAQLVDAVCSLHAAGKLHLDLKPSNVLVSTSDHVTVLDFGLARDLKHAPALSTQRLLGTPAYMAPEHAQSGRFEPASDSYAVGEMLYEALTGRLPFEGPVAHIVLSKTSRDPSPPGELCRDVPPELSELCMELLARDPAERPTGSEIMRRFGERGWAHGARHGGRTGSGLVAQELFVGRQGALESLRERSLHGSEPRIVLLHGGSGVGKTSLARRFVDELAQRPRTLVLSGACYEREAMPFKAFDGIVDSLIAHLGKLPPLEQGALLPRHAHTLARLFPAFAALAKQPSVRVRDDEDVSLGRARAFRAFAELFGRLSDQADVVLFIDDLQWSDQDSVLLLRALFEGPEPLPILLVGTYRSDEAAHSPLLADLLELARSRPELSFEDAEVGALDHAEATTLAEQLLLQSSVGNVAIAQQIASESQGVPLFIHELVRHVLREDAAPEHEVSLSEVLAGRIASLPPSAGALLEVLAAAGGPTPQRVAFRAAALSSGQESALHTLRVGGLARSRGTKGDDLVETTHDRIRVVVKQRLDEDTLAGLHARLLEAFEAEPVQDEEQLFMHSVGAGQSERALAHAERAAERACDALGFHRAVELYRTALELLSGEERVSGEQNARRARLVRGLADALAATGHCLASALAYLEAAELSPQELVSLERSAAEQLLRGGDLQRGSELLRRVLERVGVSYPRSPRAALAALAFERARLFARGLTFDERAPEQISQRELELLDSLRITLGVFWLVEPVRGALFATLYLRHALDAGHARHVLRGLETEAAYVALNGGAKGETRSGELYAAARALTHRIGSASTQSGYKLAEAGFHAIYGRKQKSTECALEALATPKQHGASWERSYARFHIYQNTLYIGGRAGLPEEIEAHVEDADSRRDRFGASVLLPMLSLAHLMADQPREAHAALVRMRTLLSDDVFSFLDMQEMIWSALCLLYDGDPGAALAHYAARADRYAVSGLPRLTTWRLLHEWGMLLAHLSALEHGLDRERNTRAAEERIKQLERERIEWPLAFASMGRAALHHLSGEREARDRQLARAIHQAEALGYQPFVALFSRSAALFAGDEQAVRRHESLLRSLGITSPARWQRTWAPCLR